MLKLAGLLGLTAALGLIGVLKAEDLKRRQRLLEEYLKMLLSLKSKINYFREPLSEHFCENTEDEKRKAFLLADEVFIELEGKEAQISQIWSEKTEKLYENTPLTGEDLEWVNYPGNFLGQTDCENQQYQFEYTERGIQAQIEDAKQAARVKGPLYRKLGFFAGGLIAVILI